MATEQELNDALNKGEGAPPAEPTEEPPPQPESADEAAPETEDAAPEGDEPAEEEERPQSRAERRIQTLANERAQAEANARAFKEQAEFFKAQAERASRQPQVDPLADLDPNERRYRELHEATRTAQIAALDAGDKASFSAACADNPTMTRYRERVEAELVKARQNGNLMVSREGIYTYLRGQDAIVQDRANAERQAKAKQIVSLQRGKPQTVKSNTGPSKGQSLEDRLKDVPI